MNAFMRPIEGNPPISDDYQEHLARRSVNPGTDYAVKRGTPIYAPYDGVVRMADNKPDGAGGRIVVIYFSNGYSGDFLHLSKLSVTNRQRVAKGDLIGYSGGSAWGSESGVGTHLHCTIRTKQTTSLGNYGNVDPELLFEEEDTRPAGSTGTPLNPNSIKEQKRTHKMKTIVNVPNFAGVGGQPVDKDNSFWIFGWAPEGQPLIEVTTNSDRVNDMLLARNGSVTKENDWATLPKLSRDQLASVLFTELGFELRPEMDEGMVSGFKFPYPDHALNA